MEAASPCNTDMFSFSPILITADSTLNTGVHINKTFNLSIILEEILIYWIADNVASISDCADAQADLNLNWAPMA